jgi:hypothetical protein
MMPSSSVGSMRMNPPPRHVNDVRAIFHPEMRGRIVYGGKIMPGQAVPAHSADI